MYRTLKLFLIFLLLLLYSYEFENFTRKNVINVCPRIWLTIQITGNAATIVTGIVIRNIFFTSKSKKFGNCWKFTEGHWRKYLKNRLQLRKTGQRFSYKYIHILISICHTMLSNQHSNCRTIAQLVLKYKNFHFSPIIYISFTKWTHCFLKHL